MLKILKIAIFTSLLCSLAPVTNAYAAAIFERLPTEIHANEKYVFYSHGLIVEGNNPTPTNPRWGLYDFPKVKAALASDKYNLIAYHRAKNTKPRAFARKLAADVNLLIKHDKIVICWSMGVTQQKSAVNNIREIVNLLLLMTKSTLYG